MKDDKMKKDVFITIATSGVRKKLVATGDDWSFALRHADRYQYSAVIGIEHHYYGEFGDRRPWWHKWIPNHNQPELTITRVDYEDGSERLKQVLDIDLSELEELVKVYKEYNPQNERRQNE